MDGISWEGGSFYPLAILTPSVSRVESYGSETIAEHRKSKLLQRYWSGPQVVIKNWSWGPPAELFIELNNADYLDIEHAATLGVWIVIMDNQNQEQILLQKRSSSVANPDCYSVSVAGGVRTVTEKIINHEALLEWCRVEARRECDEELGNNFNFDFSYLGVVVVNDSLQNTLAVVFLTSLCPSVKLTSSDEVAHFKWVKGTSGILALMEDHQYDSSVKFLHAVSPFNRFIEDDTL